MNKMINIFIKSSIISSVFLLLLGLLLIFESYATIVTISYVIGAILVVLGALAIINFIKRKNNSLTNNLDIVYGVVTIILGVLVIQNPEVIGSIIPFIVGIGIIVNSATKFKYSIELKENKNNVWKYTMITSIITAICGIILLFNPFTASEILIQIIGICISIYSILDIISTIVILHNFKSLKKQLTKEEVKVIEIEEEGTKDE